MARPLLVFFVAVLATIAAARFAYSVSANTGTQPINEAWAQNQMTFTAWNDEKWTVWIHDSAFEHLPQNTRKWHRHSKASVAFLNWQGEAWQAKIDGDEFLLARQGNWQGPITRAEAIRFQDWSGNNRLRTVADLRR